MYTVDSTPTTEKGFKRYNRYCERGEKIESYKMLNCRKREKEKRRNKDNK